MNNKHKKMKGIFARSGFTLVELVVVLALLAILASVSVGGILAYQRSAVYRKNNERARIIFNAAQSALAFYKGTGRLESMEREIAELGQSVPSDATIEAQKGRLTYLRISRSEGIQLTSASGTASLEATELYNMLDHYITDTSVYEGSICVEFDVKDGVVASVFYSDRAENFSYGSEAGAVNIGMASERTEEVRKEHAVGYCDAQLSERAPANGSGPMFSEVYFNNEETLDLTWAFKGKYHDRAREFTYQIDLYEERTDGKDKKCAEIILAPTQPMGVIPLEKEDSANAFVEGVKVTLFDENGNAQNVSDALGGWKFRVYETAENGISLSLDALDLKAADISLSSENEPYENTYAVLSGTYSAGRLSCQKDGILYGFDLNTDQNIYAKIIAATDNVSTDTVRTENSTSLLFATKDKSAEETEGRVYQIANARHLYNIRFREAEHKDGSSITYRIMNDIGWDGTDGFLARKRVSDSSAEQEGSYLECYSGTLPVQANTGKLGFPSIETLQKGSVLMGADPETPVILKGFTIRPQKSDGTWEEKAALGFVCVNDGTIENLNFTEIDVKGTRPESGEGIRNVGAICGDNQGTLRNVRVESGSVTGYEYVGGIVGHNGQGQDLVGITNGADVTGYRYVGGIVGSADGFSVIDCTNTGFVSGNAVLSSEAENTAGQSMYIGGITGYANSDADAEGEAVTKIENCTSISMPEGEDEEEITSHIRQAMESSYVGGIVGYLDGSASLKDCATEGGFVVGKYAVGGIVGARGVQNDERNIEPGKVSVSEDHPDKNENKADVIGRGFVGGIVGINGISGSTADFIQLQEQVRMNDHSLSETLPEAERVPYRLNLHGWKNSGHVLAVSDDPEEPAAYAGGIAGANTNMGLTLGTITNCTVSMPDDTAMPTFMETYLAQAQNADYIGGIAGYNNGAIYGVDGDAMAYWDVTVQVRGHHFVGGAAGYNGDTGFLSYIDVSGSQILGADHVGGITGETHTALANVRVSGEIEATEGTAGGIVGSNDSSIQEAAVNASVRAGTNAGGIAGINGIDHPDAVIQKAVFSGTVNGVENTGGITGVNAGIVDGTELLLADQTESPMQIQISAFAGNIGGYIGWNQGIYREEADLFYDPVPEDFTGTESSYAVLIQKQPSDSIANIGGIIGRNSPNAVVQSASSRPEWLVKASGAEGGVSEGIRVYAGGIVGLMESGNPENIRTEQKYEQFKNYADLQADKNLTAIGGIFGSVSSVGMSSYTIENCENYGTIRVLNSDNPNAFVQAAGIVAMLDTEYADGGAVTVQNCVNYGMIQGALAAGILGNPVNGGSERILVQYCDNVGTIAEGAGIYLALDHVGTASEVYLEYCHNFAPAEDGSGHTFCGIFGLGNYENGMGELLTETHGPEANVQIYRCIGMQTEEGQIAIAPKSLFSSYTEDADENYYLMDSSVEFSAEQSESIGRGFVFRESELTKKFPALAEILRSEKVKEKIQLNAGWDDEWSLIKTLKWDTENLYRIPFYRALSSENNAIYALRVPADTETPGDEEEKGDRIESPELETGIMPRKWQYEDVRNSDGSVVDDDSSSTGTQEDDIGTDPATPIRDDTDHSITPGHKMISWKMNAEVDRYLVEIMGLQASDGFESDVSSGPSISFEISKDAQGQYFMQMVSADKETGFAEDKFYPITEEESAAEGTSEEVPKTHTEYTLDLSRSVLAEDAYQYDMVSLRNAGKNYQISDICAQIRISEPLDRSEAATISLILPDMDDTTMMPSGYIMTQAILVTAVVQENGEEKHSYPSEWIRLYNESFDREKKYPFKDFIRVLQVEDQEKYDTDHPKYQQLSDEEKKAYNEDKKHEVISWEEGWEILLRNVGRKVIETTGSTSGAESLDPEISTPGEEITPVGDGFVSEENSDFSAFSDADMELPEEFEEGFDQDAEVFDEEDMELQQLEDDFS